MKITVAKRAGFCFGVKRAVNIAFDMASKKEGVCTLGPIIHNPQLVKRLEEQGVHCVNEPHEDMKSVIIRTHGIPIQMHDRIVDMGIEVIDATCPFVKKAQQYAKLLKEENYQVIILGESVHPEVKSIMSYVGQGVIVVEDEHVPERLKTRVGIVVQTTQPVSALKRLLNNIVERVKEIKIYNTICNSTALRLKETSEISSNVDVMIVAGGRNSANTTQLANHCQGIGVRTYHIEMASELEPSWFNGVNHVGVTAGASTPDWIIEEIIERINNIGGLTGNGIT
ncbi:MAG: 4-hydroxy-3-methylbut-2-enyl diphosphate reductase [Nitrospirae bacterium]|uniref:4-hydroxy-3-methylbut-2-enyl diphosphate reductase n=1 Tax=Candidatus Magnetobacterium casense TaxID=1455061 RepID=UPI00059019E7|nr:4-hydroxy-3-methylbut-2-enyl diphosphate reductase [Candidatus Magnetobacterium casensis]MBF0338785.1 4-hydroxy-3-methylbut-2-enyl diphosphate reductase [Nitrospirota bacterium]